MAATEQVSSSATVDMEKLGEIIARGISKGIDDARPKKMTIGDYNRREAKRNPKPALTRAYFQNGYQIPVDVLSAKEIVALNRVQRSGRYFDRKLEVIVREEGLDQIVEFRYPNKSADQRMEMKSYFRNLEDMAAQIADMQDADVTAEAVVSKVKK